MKHRHTQLAAALLWIAANSTALGQPLTTCAPEEQGVSSHGILAFVEALEAEEDAPHGIVLLRRGHVVAQGWWAPYERNAPHMLFSLSKSFTSTAVGLLADEGKLDIDDPVLSFFPDDAPEKPSANLMAMRVRDLLTMTTGHARDTVRDLTLGEDDNWPRAFLAQPVQRRPGTHFQYNTGATYMLSAIVQKLTGKTVLEYLTPLLLDPLGIRYASWESDPRGINFGGWGLKVTTEAVAKFGQLYLQNGMWRGRRLLSESWVRLATTAQTSNGSDPDNDWNQGYGFQFWRCRHYAYRGDGLFGQFCIVMPKQEAVLAITAGQPDMAKTLRLVWKHIVPAIHAEALPPDPEAHQSLVQKLAKLSLPTVEGGRASPAVARISDKSFLLDANEAGAESVTFGLDGEDSHVTLRTVHGEQKFAVGFGTWRKSVVPFHELGIPGIATSGPQPVAASAAWTAPNELTARAWLYETPYRFDMQFTFNTDARTLQMTARVHPVQRRPVAIRGAVATPADEPLAPFLGAPVFDKQRLFDDQRYPNVIVTVRGTVLAVWGNSGVVVRRSEDGGKSWGRPIPVRPTGYHGGGAIVDENSGDVLVFVEDRQPPAPLTLYRSQDDGRSWQPQDTVIEKDIHGNRPSMHMNEHGVTLQRDPHKGRLLRPSRYYGPRGGKEQWPQQYTNAVYSDDGGKTWKTSGPFPEKGTGEAALVELADGRIYYNSRVHWPERPRNRRRREAWSVDGGASWQDWRIVDVLPDGDQGRSYGCMGGLTRLPLHDRDILIFSNLDTKASHRERVTVWVSFDGGRTWPLKRLIDAGRSGYSSLAVGRPGTASEGWIYLHYEHDPIKGSHLARFNLAWVLGGERTGDGEVPPLRTD